MRSLSSFRSALVGLSATLIVCALALGNSPSEAATTREVRAPQFVLSSFDGASDPELIAYWEQVAKDTKSQFTFFFSSVYLLDFEHRKEYKPPRRPAGSSSIGFARIPPGVKPATKIRATITALRNAQKAGNEVGTHFAGHFCGTFGVNRWYQEDWAAELRQVDQLAARVDSIMKLSPKTGGPFLSAPKGGRTPCLEGKPGEYLPAMRERGMVYDTSPTRGLTSWPNQRSGMWRFGVPFVYPPGSSRGLLLADYNFSLRLRGTASWYAEDFIYRTLMKSFNTVYTGNRAPLDLAAHTQRLMRGAWNRAVARFYKAVCAKADVRCTTYSAATTWMEQHKSQLPRLQRSGTYIEDVPPPTTKPTTTRPATTVPRTTRPATTVAPTTVPVTVVPTTTAPVTTVPATNAPTGVADTTSPSTLAPFDATSSPP